MNLPEDNPSLVSKMIECCYLGDYEGIHYHLENDCEKQPAPLQINVEMYAMLEKFGMDGMKPVAREKVFNFLKMKITEQDISAKCAAILNAIPRVYGNMPRSDRGLRDPIVRYVANAWPFFEKMDQLEPTIGAHPDFILDVIAVRGVGKELLYHGSCRSCNSANKWKTSHVICDCGWVQIC